MSIPAVPSFSTKSPQRLAGQSLRLNDVPQNGELYADFWDPDARQQRHLSPKPH
ncbi:hypothetical protein SIIN_9210_T [Serendipita indica DSM 11827]|nr:hypothetical protein SIIN_9210_T [Serendipita indica DSM 11827]